MTFYLTLCGRALVRVRAIIEITTFFGKAFGKNREKTFW